MKSSIEDVSPVEKRIVVEVEPERVAKAIDEAYRTLSRPFSKSALCRSASTIRLSSTTKSR